MPRPQPKRSSFPRPATRPSPKSRPKARAAPRSGAARLARRARPARPGHPDRASRGPKWAPGSTPKNPSIVRLQRVMADAGVASRRECEDMIVAGRVEVNNAIVTDLPIFVDPATDRITVDGRLLPRSDRATRRIYVMLNKPDNTLGTTRDQLEYAKGGRRTVVDLVDHPSGARLFPVGRLDFHSTGLVLMTNDGDLAERLTHARYGVTKTFRVWINGQVRPDILDMLRRRIGKRDSTDPDGRPTGGVRVISGDEERRNRRDQTSGPDPANRRARRPIQRAEDSARAGTVLEIHMREGKTDPLDEMLTSVGCRVRRIARTAIGPLKLAGVRPGEWRELTKDELAALREAAGLGKSPGRGPPARAPRPKPQPASPAESRDASGSTDDEAAGAPAAQAPAPPHADPSPEAPA